MSKYVILVAGYEYQHAANNFLVIADRRRQHLLQFGPAWRSDPDLVFVRFNVKDGVVERATGNGAWTAESIRFDAVNRRTHYSGKDLIKAQTNLMSITDIYRYIIELGKREPGSVVEFSVIGHAWFGGPVLLNSYQREEYRPGAAQSSVRDPWDKDGRVKDFFSQNMPDADWVAFKAAFEADGYYWIWGCLFPRAYFNTLHYIMQTTAFRSKAIGQHQLTDSFTITVNASFVRDYYPVDPQFFPTSTTELTFTRTLQDVLQFLKRGMLNSYPGRFTLDTGIPCIAGYLGTYSDYERAYSGHQPRYPLMIIPRNAAVYGSDFSRVIAFYKAYLQIQEDPEQKGFALYRYDQIMQWWRDTNP